MPEFFHQAASMLMRDEGFSARAYLCSEGYLTLGYGRNIETNGVSREESEIMLVNDMVRCLDDLETFPWWDRLNDPRKCVMLNMRYQLGAGGLRGFKKTLSYLDRAMYQEASKEMLNSRWANQTPNRAHRLSKIMSEGKL